MRHFNYFSFKYTGGGFLGNKNFTNLILFLDEENFSYSKACEAFEGDEESCRNCRILHVLNDCLIDRRCVSWSPTCFPTTQQKTHNLFWPDENSIEQCCAAHIVQGCQQYCSTLLHLTAG